MSALESKHYTGRPTFQSLTRHVRTYMEMGSCIRKLFSDLSGLSMCILNLFFLLFFAIHSSSIHKKHRQILQTLFWVCQHSRNTCEHCSFKNNFTSICNVVVWRGPDTLSSQWHPCILIECYDTPFQIENAFLCPF
jgi:hypothetical protein